MITGGKRRDLEAKTMQAFPRFLMALVVLPLVACGSGADDGGGMDMGGTADGERQEFAFTGTVQRVDTATQAVAVQNEDIPGWMMSMTMSYAIDPPELVPSLEPGDRITAKVYSGDFGKLYAVEVLPPQ